jgi:3-methyladenine DNA glycosylase AlkD
MIIKATQELDKRASKVRAQSSVRFFKEVTDEFIGVSVPDIRMVAKQFFAKTTLKEIRELLLSSTHEYKTLSLEMLVFKYEHADKQQDQKTKKEIIDFYLKNCKYADNWDLVDTSASYILGEYLVGEALSTAQCEKFLENFIESKNIWERRVAIISTHAFIKVGEIELALAVSKQLLKDTEDLIHKAVGWTLREAWKKNASKVEDFIRKNYDDMNRTTLRYAIERIAPEKRQKILKKTF